MPDFLYENNAREKGYRIICGIDEAGRGPLAGPVCAAAVVFDEDVHIEGLNDSKKLSEKKREELFDIICEKAAAYSIAFASVEEIEEHNILQATFIAMKRAFENLSIDCDYALIDGNRIPADFPVDSEAVIKGDFHSCSIAAASILAKVSRDRLMYEYDAKFPQYAFLKHKGYGTKQHIDAIKEFGACEIHRPSFIGKFLK